MIFNRRTALYGFASMIIAATLSTTVLPVAAQSTDAKSDVIVFAAASLKNALDAIVTRWQTETGQKAKVSYESSSTLAKQIEQDAPAQIFISADQDWMDYVAAKKLIKTGSRTDLLGNTLVLIAPKTSNLSLEIRPGFDLAAALGGGRLAMGSITSVPAGKYGKAALEKLGAWAPVADKIAQAQNVRAALLLVSRGEAPLGIVYKTDAFADPNVKIVGTFPADSHPPIIYPVALTNTATASAQSLLDYIKSAKVVPDFEGQGFIVLKR